MVQPKLHVEIILKECLEEHWADWFEGFGLAAEGSVSTRLAGDVSDQAALHGILERIRDLNLSLVSIQVTDLFKKG